MFFQFLLSIMNQTFKNFNLQKEKKASLTVLTLLQLERQLHEDEEFARTLAMLDEEPKTKKVAFEWAVCILNIQYRSVFPFIPVYSRLWRCNHE